MQYGLLRRPDNQGYFWQFSPRQLMTRGFWKIKKCDLPSVSFDVETKIYHAKYQPKVRQAEAELFSDANVISSYSTMDAVADGVLAPVAEYDGGVMLFTAGLLADYEEEGARAELVEEGVSALNEPDTEEDHEYRRMRVLKKGQDIWLFEEPWEGMGSKVTFMYPSEY